MLSFLKTIFRPIGKAISWIMGGDEERLRAARARAQKEGESHVEKASINESKEQVNKKSGPERYADEFNVWEEIDSYRTTFWFGSKMGRMMSRSRRREEQLEKELEELDRKREEENTGGKDK
jgi:hypothetical protein